jgi:hypothetical protein
MENRLVEANDVCQILIAFLYERVIACAVEDCNIPSAAQPCVVAYFCGYTLGNTVYKAFRNAIATLQNIKLLRSIQTNTCRLGIMRFALLSLLPAAFAFPAALPDSDEGPVYWLLAGDSTTATNGGWGDAFLSTTVAEGSSGVNYGHSGATTKSFRAGGDWGELIDEVSTHKASYRVYVTIQV